MGSGTTDRRICIERVEINAQGQRSAKKIGVGAHYQCWQTAGKSRLSRTLLDEICPVQSAQPTSVLAREATTRILIFVSPQGGTSTRQQPVEIEVELAELRDIDIALSLGDYSKIFPHGQCRSLTPVSVTLGEAKSRDHRRGPPHLNDPRQPVPADGTGVYWQQGRHPVSPPPTEPVTAYPHSVQSGSSWEGHSSSQYPGNTSSDYTNLPTTSRILFNYDHADPFSDEPPVPWQEIESYHSFYENTQARQFWSWDQTELKWKHFDAETGETLVCPDELD